MSCRAVLIAIAVLCVARHLSMADPNIKTVITEDGWIRTDEMSHVEELHEIQVVVPSRRYIPDVRITNIRDCSASSEYPKDKWECMNALQTGGAGWATFKLNDIWTPIGQWIKIQFETNVEVTGFGWQNRGGQGANFKGWNVEEVTLEFSDDSIQQTIRTLIWRSVVEGRSHLFCMI